MDGGKLDQSPREATAQRDLMTEIERTKRTVLRAIILATLLILGTIFYLRSQDPYWRCKRLNEGDISGRQIEVWEELECNDWPGI